MATSHHQPPGTGPISRSRRALSRREIARYVECRGCRHRRSPKLASATAHPEPQAPSLNSQRNATTEHPDNALTGEDPSLHPEEIIATIAPSLGLKVPLHMQHLRYRTAAPC